MGLRGSLVIFVLFCLVFFVLESPLGIARQWSFEKFRSHVRILIYRTWAIDDVVFLFQLRPLLVFHRVVPMRFARKMADLFLPVSAISVSMVMDSTVQVRGRWSHLSPIHFFLFPIVLQSFLQQKNMLFKVRGGRTQVERTKICSLITLVLVRS